jgi:hypothetical protein
MQIDLKIVRSSGKGRCNALASSVAKQARWRLGDRRRSDHRARRASERKPSVISQTVVENIDTKKNALPLIPLRAVRHSTASQGVGRYNCAVALHAD